jgi:DnaD/phage-associated family protein
MRYTILGFNQRLSIEYGLDMNDLLLLRWFIDFYHSGKMVKMNVREKGYAWINYKKIIEDIPILNMQKTAVARRLMKLCDIGLMEHETLKQGGTFSLYKLTSKYEELISDTQNDEGSTQKYEGYDSKVAGGSTQKYDKNINILNNNKLNIKDDIEEDTIFDYLQKNGFILTPIHYEIIREWEDNELTRYAIQIAVLNNVYKISYIDKILYNFKVNNITTVEQAKALKCKSNYQKIESDVPEWFDKDFNEDKEIEWSEFTDEQRERMERLIAMDGKQETNNN